MEMAIQSVQTLPNGRVQISGRRHVPSWKQRLLDETYKPGVIQFAPLTMCIEASAGQVPVGTVAGVYTMVQLLLGVTNIEVRSAGSWIVATDAEDLPFDGVLSAVDALEEFGGQLFLTKRDGSKQSVHEALLGMPGILAADNGKYLVLARG